MGIFFARLISRIAIGAATFNNHNIGICVDNSALGTTWGSKFNNCYISCQLQNAHSVHFHYNVFTRGEVQDTNTYSAAYLVHEPGSSWVTGVFKGYKRRADSGGKQADACFHCYGRTANSLNLTIGNYTGTDAYSLKCLKTGTFFGSTNFDDYK